MQEQKICPYPGLRPFNEEESIFFRGREEHIEKIISQLEEKKFVMLTGASGDGKSSIVYAGVIPNARAGFFKAKFNSWQIADFRPERSPLKNMAVALSEKLGYNDVTYVEKELNFGFSSLINLYKRSKYYLDQNSDIWKSVDDTEKKKLKRKAANLFILVDQFEEFFTNAENYHNGKASVQSQLVINLLLETAKIALAEDLPIYIICTMRSDYIGQCAAFRGLPEYIGFSQFFVPRLKRKEIHQVIEEPATLSGNTISNRLTETLINELGEGFDQLPVLQHALNQVWNQADKGHEEMDLIHLAKLSGLPEKNLPVEDKQKFSQWFENIADFKKSFFKNPSLENVLNSHANELYQTACEYYNAHHEEKISKEDACAIIKATFQCLTKIDDSRAVRNRMTLDEITNIINRGEITAKIVGDVLEVFRLQGNTFLKPFITTDESSKNLKPEDVLDITHESLIRNWELLEEWAKEEYDNWVNFLDFNKQLQRWINNKKANGYLLPIGPLTFFEEWYNKCKPNKYWLVKYDESESPWEEKLSKAEITLQNAGLFIKKSSDKLFFSRFVLKHGARKLTIGLIYIIFLPLCIHYYFDYKRKQNDWIINDIEQKGTDLLRSSKVSNDTKADFLVNLERLEPGSFTQALDDIHNDTMAFDISFEMFGFMNNYEKRVNGKVLVNPLIFPLLKYMDQRLDNLTNRQRVSFKTTHSYDFSRINKFLSLCTYVKSYNDNGTINKFIDKNAFVLNIQLKDILEKTVDSGNVNIAQFNNSIQLLLAIAPKTDFDYFINKFSPWEGNDEAKARFARFYGDDKTNGYKGYQIMANLYAADSANNDENIGKIQSCLEMAIFNGQNYTKNTNFFNFYDIISTMSMYGKLSMTHFSKMLNDYSKSSSTDLFKVMDKTIADNFNKHIPYEKITEFFSQSNYYAKYFCNDQQRNTVWNDYLYLLDEVRKTGKVFHYVDLDKATGSKMSEKTVNNFNTNEFNFCSAIYYKKRGTYCQEVLNNSTESNADFKKAFEFYGLLPAEFADANTEVGTFSAESTPKILKRSYVFLYPKVLNEYCRTTYYGNGVGNSCGTFGMMPEQSGSVAFYNYIRKNGLDKYYYSEDGMKMLERFSYSVFENNFKSDSVFYSFVDHVSEMVDKDRSLTNYFDYKFFDLALINRDFENNDTAKAFKRLYSIYKDVDIMKLINLGFLKDKNVDEEFNYASNREQMLSSLAKHLAINNHMEESFKIINLLKGFSRRNLLIASAYALQEKGPVENSFVYLDSLFYNNDMDGKPKFGMKLLRVLGMVGSQDAFDISMKLIKDIPESSKQKAMSNFIKGVAYNGFYHRAVKNIPETVSSNEELQLYNRILQTEITKNVKKSNQPDLFFDTTDGNNDTDYEWEFIDYKF